MQLHHDDKVILFPKWKKELEKESLHALKNKQYEEALFKLDQLISYRIQNHEIMTGKLICLMELGRWTEAQNLCEDLLHEEDENYYNYIHIYLTILFQTNQYDLLMQQVEIEISKKDLPEVQREQFLQLYEISEKMNMDVKEEEEKLLFQQLFDAVEARNFREQYRQVEKLKLMQANPSNQIIDLLTKEYVHPLTKTTILEWLKESGWSEKVDVAKFDFTVSVFPNELEDLEEQEIIRETIYFLKEIENENPSLYHLIYQMMYHFTHIFYPIKPPKEDYVYIASAMEIIGRESLGLLGEEHRKSNQKVDFYIEQVNMAEALFLSIIEG